MKKALLVGVNQYDTQKDLRGCLTDVAEMEAMLSGTFGFEVIEKITDSQVSRETLIHKIRTILNPNSGENDGARLVFFAGHGGRTIEVGPGDETDKVDENLCMPDYDWAESQSYLIDDDLGRMLDEAHTAAPFLRKYVVLDSCHSGTGTRSPGNDWDEVFDYLTRSLRLDITSSIDICRKIDWGIEDGRLPTIAVSRQASESPEVNARLSSSNQNPIDYSTMGASVSGAEPTSHLLLSGCAAAQTCKDVPLDGGYHGIFTYSLTRAAANSPTQSWSELQHEVSDLVEGFGQNPQLEGPADLKLRPIFS